MRGKVVINYTWYELRLERVKQCIYSRTKTLVSRCLIYFIFTSSFVFFFLPFSLLLVFTSFSLLICFVSLFTSYCFVSNITKSIVSNIFISDNQTLLADLQDFCHLTANFMLISLTKDVKENFIVFSCEHNGAQLVLSFEASSSFPII